MKREFAGNEITIGGARFAFRNRRPQAMEAFHARRGRSHGRASITAAMPGKIVRVLVAVGEEVAAGQGILVIEAMKMQNELKSPRGGRVTAIEVKENDSVNAGALLVDDRKKRSYQLPGLGTES